MTGTGRWLIVGATGLLGQAAMNEANRRGIDATGVARYGTDITLDITDADAVRRVLRDIQPDVVLNAAALTEIDVCETDPAFAHKVNTEAVGTLARKADAIGAHFIHVSTDQFWTGEGPKQHDENAPVTLVNAYARSKYEGEQAAFGHAGALVVRTNVTGFRGWSGRPTFAEWCFEAIRGDKPITLFTDAFTSTIDAAALACALFDLAAIGMAGLVNVGAREVSSKAAFIRGLARTMDRPLHHAREGSVKSLKPRRADSLGLDVRKAEAALGYALPGAAEVWRSLVLQAEEFECVM